MTDPAPIRLTTRRLILRPLDPGDAAAMFRYRSRPEVYRYQLWLPADEAEIRAFIEKQARLAPGSPGTWYSLAVTLKEGGLMVGDIGMHFPAGDPGQAEVGITLSPAHQRRGFAGEALREVLRFLFEDMQQLRVYASVDPRNRPSVRLLEKVGLRKEAFLPGSLVVRGERVDDAVYSIHKSDFRPSV